MNNIYLLQPKSIQFAEVLNPLTEIIKEEILFWWNNYQISHPKLFNGNIIAYHDHIYTSENKLKLNWFLTNYAHYLQRSSDINLIKPASAIFCSILLFTSEGTIAIVKMSSNTSVPNKLMLPGGNIEIKNGKNITISECKENASRELFEELGINILSSQLEFWRLKMGGIFNDVGFIYINKIRITEDYIRSKFSEHLLELNKKNRINEIKEILFINNETKNIMENFEIVDYLPSVIKELYD